MLSKRVAIFLTIIFSSCNTRSNSNVFSFNEDDYKLDNVLFAPDSSKIGERLVNKIDPNLSLRKFYWQNNKIKAEIFYYNDKKFGPSRLYDISGELINEKFIFSDKDSTDFIYDQQKQILKRKSD